MTEEHFRSVEGEQTEAREQPHLISRRAADITPRHIDFLWPGRLALGKHTAFAGEPGDGKSQLSIYVAATISRGGKWPCDEGYAPLSGNVIIFNAEDGVADTIVPRLIAAGADMERIHIVSAVLLQDGKGRRTFNLQADLALLEEKIREIGGVVLVIIDPISSYMGKIDSHKNSEVRGALEPLSELAERMRVAVLSITHFSKAGSGTTSKALHRFIGSIAFVGAPRAAFAVIEDADNEGRMLLLHAKNNMALKPQGLAYRLHQTIVGDSIVASYVHWEDTPVTISADQALGATESAGSRTMKDEATDFLRDTLGQDEVPVEDVQQAARKAGITPKPLRVAREALKVRSRREGFGPGAVWKWNLPGGSIDALAPIDAHSLDKASMDPEGIYGGRGGAPVWQSGDSGERASEAEYRRRLDAKSRQGNGKQPDAVADDKPDPAGEPEPLPPERGPVDHYAKGALMDHVNSVIEEHLRNLDEACKARREAVLVMQDSKEDAGLPPQVDAVAEVPHQAERAPPAANVINVPDPVPTRPMLEGNRRRAAILARNQEALQRQEAEIRRSHH